MKRNISHDFILTLNNARMHKFLYNNKKLNFMNKNTIMCHICRSLFYRLRNCSKNNKYQQAQYTHSVYQPIYKRYQVKTPTTKGGFNPLFPKQQYEEPTNYWKEGLDN
ncbi:hypothetical protein RhiirA5_433592 [Rhizophagus irregularis]|uniref:Uncharacterized protein n=1 Tax=Rhizophagus irregularis TaxID=588596 RepID=A0A2N0NRI0_9GLOM|nr:hypothetical protein RhiirA5_433592 [Rhizophagus irregularis]